jgi:hypothetical protein
MIFNKKIIFFKLIFILFFAGITTMLFAEQSSFYLNLVITREEHSKDNNSETVTLVIKDNKIDLKFNYKGFKAQEDKSYSKILDDETINLIINYIKKENLNVNIKEIKKTECIGIVGFLDFELIIDKVKTNSQIAGIKSVWILNDHERKEWKKKKYLKTNIENIDYFNKCDSFIYKIKLLFNDMYKAYILFK